MAKSQKGTRVHSVCPEWQEPDFKVGNVIILPSNDFLFTGVDDFDIVAHLDPGEVVLLLRLMVAQKDNSLSTWIAFAKGQIGYFDA